MRVDIAGEMPIVISVTNDDERDIWIMQDIDNIAMTRDQARQVRDALDKLLTESAAA